MTVAELKAVLSGLPDDMPVHVIMDGVIDRDPDWNVSEGSAMDILYIEGIRHR